MIMEVQNKMDRKITNIVAYLTPVGLIIAFVAGDRAGAKFHLNQALVLALCSICLGVIGNVVSLIPLLGGLLGIVVWLVSIGVFALYIMGLVNAIQDVEKPLPVIGGVQLLK